MRGDSRKNEMYMSWSSDGESSPSKQAASKGLSVSNNGGTGTDAVAPVSPSEAPNSPAEQAEAFYTYSGDDDADEEAAVGEEESPVRELEKDKLGHKKWVALVLLLTALGVGVYIWLGRRHTKNATRIPAAPPTSNANPDTSTVKPDTDPDMPSLAPTAPRIFDPPSAQDCIAIARGETLEGQDELMVERYEVVLDVAFDSGGLAIDGILNRLRTEIRQIILPEILGCGDAKRRMMEIDSGAVDDSQSAYLDVFSIIRGNAKRMLSSSTSPSARYIMANAAVAVRNPQGEWCKSGSGPLCYRVIVSLDVALRSDGLKVLSVVEFIAQAFKTPDSLVDKLFLGRPFQKIFVRDIYPSFHTAIPTTSPSHF